MPLVTEVPWHRDTGTSPIEAEKERLSAVAAMEEVGELVDLNPIEDEIRSHIFYAAEEQRAVQFAVGIDGVHELESGCEVEAGGVRHTAEELARITFHVHTRNDGDVDGGGDGLSVDLAGVTRSENDFGSVVVVEIERSDLHVGKICHRINR